MSRAWIIAALLAAGTAVRAQPVPAPPATDPDDEAARALYREGDALYAEGRYEQAIAKFEQSFALSARPDLLFNLANAHERIAQYQQAAEALRRYLPDAPEQERVALRKRIARLDERAARQREHATARERDRAELVALRARECPVCEVAPPPRASRVWGYAALGSGAVAIATGVVFGVVARDAHDDAQQHCNGLCKAEADGDLERERRFSLFADISIGTGIAATGAGLYLLWRARRHDERIERRTAVAPAFGRDWMGVTFAGSF